MESHKDGRHFPWLSRLPTWTRRPFNLVIFTRAFLLAQTTKFEMRKKIVHLPGRMLRVRVQTTKLDCRRVDVPPFCLSWEIMPAFVRFHRLFIEIERAHAGASMKYNKVQKSEKLPSWRIASKSSKMIQRGNFLSSLVEKYDIKHEFFLQRPL